LPTPPIISKWPAAIVFLSLSLLLPLLLPLSLPLQNHY
jgi:hypothetical protein